MKKLISMLLAVAVIIMSFAGCSIKAGKKQKVWSMTELNILFRSMWQWAEMNSTKHRW